MAGLLDELERQINPVGVDGYDPGLEASLRLGLKSNPDKEAAVRRRAARVGMPSDLVRQSEAAARTADVHGLIQDMDTHPKTRSLMANPDNAAIAHDATDSLTKVEKEGGFFSRIGSSVSDFGGDIGDKIGNAFEKGQLTHRLGYEGHDLKDATGPDRAIISKRIEEIKTQMDGLGVSNDGFLGFLTSAAEIVGQQYGTFSQPEASQRVAFGGAFGGAAGLAGGPFAPVTVPAGAAVGLVSGTISHLATDAFIVESGHAYIDMIESGIDEDTAEVVAMGVGVINAGLEVLGTAAVTIPVTKAVKTLAKRAMGEALKSKSVISAARNFAVGYGTAVGGETATEIMQEAVLIAAEEIARQFTDAEQDIKPITMEEAVSRMEEVAIKTFKGMAVLALPGSSANYVTDRSKAKEAMERDQTIETIAEAVDESPVSERSPEVMADHVMDAMDIEAVDMPIEAFDEMLSDLGYVSKDILTDDALILMYDEAQQIGGDVRIPAGALVQNVMIGENKAVFDKYRPHIRWNPGDMTAAEAVEFQASGIENELATNVKQAIEEIEEAEATLTERLAKVGQAAKQVLTGKEQEVSSDTQETGQGPVETNLKPELKLAEDSLGLQALFRTADEAGMTQKQYETYLATVQRAATESNRRKDIAQAKREGRQVTKEIKAEQEALRPALTESIGNEPIYAAIRGLGIQKLDRQSILDAYGEDSKIVIDELRKAGASVTNIGDPSGVHIDIYADLFDLDSGDIMVNSMRDVTPETQEVTRRAEQEVRIQNPELFSRQAEIQENLTALMHDNTQRVLAAEIDALTEDRKAGRVKPALVREVARRSLEQHVIRDISVSKYLANARKHGREAGRALRAGDREAARQAKVNQLLNMEFAKQAEAKRQIVQKGHEYLARFTKSTRKWSSLGPGYLDAIRGMISQFSLSPDLTSSKRTELQDFVKKAQEDGANFEFPQRLLDDDKRNYKDFTIHDFELVIQKVRELHKAGVKAEQDRAAGRRTKTAIRVDAVVASLADVKAEQTLETRGRKQSNILSFEEAKLLLLNADSILKNLDNFKDLGPVYQAIKASIDQSVTNGYGTETNFGLINREKKIAENLLDLYKVFSKEELNTLSRANIVVPGSPYLYPGMHSYPCY